MKDKKVLLVEDDPIANFLNREILKECSIGSIEVVYNGYDALQSITGCITDKRCPDLILLDVNMPVMDGFEFLEALEDLKEMPQLKIVLLTSFTKLPFINAARNFKILGTITKPLTKEKLEEIVLPNDLEEPN